MSGARGRVESTAARGEERRAEARHVRGHPLAEHLVGFIQDQVLDSRCVGGGKEGRKGGARASE